MTSSPGGRSADRPPLITPAFLLLSLAHLLSTASILALNLLPLFVEDLGGGPFIIGVVMATGVVSGILFRPALGRWMDARGRGIVFAFCGSLNVIGFFSYIAIDELSPLLYLVRLIHGVGTGGLFAAYFTTATDLIPDGRRAEGIAIFGISGIAAGGVGPFVGEMVLNAFGFTPYFLTLAGMASLSLIATLVLGRWGGLSKPSSIPAATHMKEIIFEPGRLRLWLVVAAFGFTIGGFAIFVAPHVARESLGSVSLYFIAYSASAVLLRTFFSTVPERVGLRRALAPALLTLFVAGLALAFDRSDRGLVIAGVLGGIGHGFTFPILGALAVEHAPRSERGAVMSVFTSAIDVGFLLSGPVLGLIARPHGYPAAFVACGAVAVFGVAIFYAKREGGRTPGAHVDEVAQPR